MKRTPMHARTFPLRNTTPLVSGTPLTASPLVSGTPLTASRLSLVPRVPMRPLSAKRARPAHEKSAAARGSTLRRDVTCSMCQGPQDSASGYCPACQQVRRKVLERDGYRCVCCGRSVIGQPFMLLRRLRDGGDSPANLITVAGTVSSGCAERIARRRDPADEVKGYWLRSRPDPAAFPVMIFGENGSGMTIFLGSDGPYRGSPQEVRP